MKEGEEEVKEEEVEEQARNNKDNEEKWAYINF